MRTKKIISIALVFVALLMISAFSLDIKSGDSVAIFNNLTIPGDTTVTGDAIAVFGSMDIRGTVRGDAVAVFGSVDIYGEVEGDVVAVFGSVDIKSRASVGGDIVGVFGGVDKENGAVIKGEIVDTKGSSFFTNINLLPDSKTEAGSIVGMLITYAFACLALVLVPDRIAFMAERYKFNLGRSLGIGALVLLVLVLLLPVLVITIIGILPAFFLVVLLMVAMLASLTALYIALGRKVAAAVEGKNAVYIQLLIGLVIVGSLQMIPIAGFIISLAVYLVALGVAFDTRVGKPFVRRTRE